MFKLFCAAGLSIVDEKNYKSKKKKVRGSFIVKGYYIPRQE